jgi:L-fuculose-phosphate aldolase
MSVDAVHKGTPMPSESHQTVLDAAEVRHMLVDISRQLVALGLNRGTSGNCSSRSGDGFLITPSGLPIEEMTEQSLVAMAFDGSVMGAGKPSSEWRFHRDILAARADVNAVVHVHSLFATTLACLHKEVPAFHYMISVAGGDSIRCAPYALFGSQALSDLALVALQDRKACLLANHGMIALGRDLKHALAVTVQVEMLCEQYFHALQIGQPFLLSSSQMQDVYEQFRDYGQWRDNRT